MRALLCALLLGCGGSDSGTKTVFVPAIQDVGECKNLEDGGTARCGYIFGELYCQGAKAGDSVYCPGIEGSVCPKSVLACEQL
jgi:hypothetical protein